MNWVCELGLSVVGAQRAICQWCGGGAMYLGICIPTVVFYENIRFLLNY